jgi:hypothetical protein
MNVYVDQSRCNQLTGGIDNGLGGLVDGAYFGDYAVDNKQITFFIDAVGRVDYTAVFY